MLRINIKFLDKLSETSLKGSLELLKGENWTAIAFTAFTELIEATRQKKIRAHWHEGNCHSFLDTHKSYPLNTFKKFIKRRASGYAGGDYSIPKKTFLFSKEDILSFTMKIHYKFQICIHKLLNTKIINQY